MRTVIYTFDGTPTDGDLMLISCRSARGGESTVKCLIGDPVVAREFPTGREHWRFFRKALTLEAMCSVLAEEINSNTSEWCPGAGDFKAHAKGKRLSVMCSTLLNDVTFHCNVEGAQTETCDIEVLG